MSRASTSQQKLIDKWPVAAVVTVAHTPDSERACRELVRLAKLWNCAVSAHVRTVPVYVTPDTDVEKLIALLKR